MNAGARLSESACGKKTLVALGRQKQKDPLLLSFQVFSQFLFSDVELYFVMKKIFFSFQCLGSGLKNAKLEPLGHSRWDVMTAHGSVAGLQLDFCDFRHHFPIVGLLDVFPFFLYYK